MPGILSKFTKIIKDQIPKRKQPWDLMVIPFEKEAPKYVSKEDRLTFKLRSTPSNMGSITYKLKTYAFDDGSPEEWLEHMKTYRKIIKGQNITSGEPAFAILKQLLKGFTGIRHEIRCTYALMQNSAFKTGNIKIKCV